MRSFAVAIDVGDYLSRAITFRGLPTASPEGRKGQSYTDTQCLTQINDVAIAPSEEQRLAVRIRRTLFPELQTLVRLRLGQEGLGSSPLRPNQTLLERYFEPELTLARNTASPILCSDIESRDYHYDFADTMRIRASSNHQGRVEPAHRP